ncbi:MAG TPA: type IV pilus secretin PilQ [Terriglobales bacterium]|jgi:type IV pilus assembly protein PilQ|nr:type IV pilus secretin PilQ [Terriglobales bacterium]
MRIMRRAMGATALVAAALILMSGALPASDGPVVHVKAVVKNGNVTLEAQANGPFEYTTYRPSESLFVLDLSGVSSADPAGARVVASDLVKSYRMLTYTSGAKPVVRIEILLSQGVEPRLERKDSQELSLLVGRTDDAAGKSAIVTGPAPAIVPIAAKSSETKLPSSTIEAIRQVNLSQNGDLTDVNVVGTGKLNYHAMRLQNPDRLVLDFSGAHLKTSEKHIASNLEPVREIRLAQFSPEVSRIVIDLRQATPYNITSSDSGITIEFSAKATKGAVKSTPSAQPVDVTTTKLESPKPAPAVSEATQPKQVSAPVIILPSTLTQPTAALAIPAVAVPQPQDQQVGLAAKQVATEGAASASNPNGADASASAPASASSQPITNATVQAQTPPASGKYSGEPISVNLKDVDLRDFFRLIHEISGLNIVVDPSVKGSLTIVLDDVPWDQALDIVLKNNGLDKQLDGNVLRIATKDTLKKEADQNRELAKAQAEAADVVTTTRQLSYAKAEDLVPTLKKFLSSRGDVLADSRSNTLIIRDIPSVLPVMDNLLRQLDRKSQQVEIEARVVAANRSFTRDIGTQFAAAVSLGGGQSVLGGASTVGTSPIVRNSPTPLPPIIVGTGGSNITSGSMPLITNLGATTPTSALSYAFSSQNFALDFIISAAEERGVGKLISKPKVITQNNQKAIVKQGTKIPVQTIVNNTVSVQFVDAVLELDVTPQITAEGTIYMDVTVTNDQIDTAIPRVQGIPAIDTQQANTKVLVSDGATVVIGGIIVSSQQRTVDQVPLFGSIPVVGNLFKHTLVNTSSLELLFFLTPRILPS